MMNIGYISADYGIPVFGNKGAAVHIQEMVRAFARLGHDVRVLAARIGERAYHLPAEVSEIQAPPADSHRFATGSSEKQRSKEQRNIAIAQQLEREIERQHALHPFDLLYERHSLWSLAATRTAKRLGIPVAVELNAPLIKEQVRYRKLVLEDRAMRIEREVFSSADIIFAVSDEVARYAVENGAEDRRVRVQPNGVNPETFSPEVAPAQIEGLGHGPVIGFSGSLKPWHGLEDLLEAFVCVHGALPDSRLLVVGDGPLLAWVEGFARGARLTDAVITTGWQAHQDLPSFINAMDIACAPYPDIDGFYFSPLKLFEYMACGRAIVASGMGQIKTVVNDGVNGLLTEPGNVDQLAQTLISLADDPERLRRLGRQAAASVKGKTWDDNARNVLALAGAASTRSEIGLTVP